MSLQFVPIVRHPEHDVYKRVKGFYQELGSEFERVFAEAVGGEAGWPGDPGDVFTRQGWWEFASSPNSKNASGDRADLKRAEGHCVQVTGPTRVGWMGAADFLARHDCPDPEGYAVRLVEQAMQNVITKGEQLSLA